METIKYQVWFGNIPQTMWAEDVAEFLEWWGLPRPTCVKLCRKRSWAKNETCGIATYATVGEADFTKQSQFDWPSGRYALIRRVVPQVPVH